MACLRRLVASRLQLRHTSSLGRAFSASQAPSSSNVELTSKRYPDLKRGGFASLEDSDLDAFKGVLGEDRVLTAEEDVDGEEE